MPKGRGYKAQNPHPRPQKLVGGVIGAGLASAIKNGKTEPGALDDDARKRDRKAREKRRKALEEAGK